MSRPAAIGWISAIGAMLVALFVLGASNSQRTKRLESIVEVGVVNPYRFDVEALVECDWDHKLQMHRFRKVYRFVGRSESLLKVPTWVKRCRLYPKLKLF